MTVKKLEKKVLRLTPENGTMATSPELQQIREMIATLPPDTGEDMEAAANEASTKGPRKVTKKKATAKSKVQRVVKNASKDEGTTLSQICKSMKLEPRTARRKLRNADGVPEAGARWTWTKAADIEKVKKILQA
jgi:hypothetical protein